MTASQTVAAPGPGRRLMLSVVFAVVVVGLVALGLWFGHRAAPGTVAAGQSVAGLDQAQIQQRMDDVTRSFAVPVSVGSKTVTASAADLGVSIDSGSVAVRATGFGTVASVWFRDRLGEPTDVPVTVTVDQVGMQNWLDTTFATQMDPVAEPSLAFDATTDAYAATPGHAGSAVDAAPLIAQLPALLSGTRSDPVVLRAVPAQPSITDAQVQAAQERLTAMLATTLAIMSPVDNSTLYTAAPADIAGWVSVRPDPTVGQFTIGVDRGALTAFVTDTLPDRLATVPLSQAVPSGSGAGTAPVGDGHPVLTNPTTVVSAWYSALTSRASGDVVGRFAVAADPTPAPVVAAAPTSAPAPPITHAGHWVDVDLTTQTATLYDGDQAGASFTISSGAPSTPTPTGSYQVYSKVPIQSLNGSDFHYDNVRWCVWFFGNYGFHTAYWNTSFGTPVSHGCINMTEADAQQVYDWVGVGSPVEVHQ